MKKLKKLKLQKDTITKLEDKDQNNLKGGFSSGCSDGCLSPWRHTDVWNCSNGGCTNDCGYCGDPTWIGSANCPV